MAKKRYLLLRKVLVLPHNQQKLLEILRAMASNRSYKQIIKDEIVPQDGAMEAMYNKLCQRDTAIGQDMKTLVDNNLLPTIAELIASNSNINTNIINDNNGRTEGSMNSNSNSSSDGRTDGNATITTGPVSPRTTAFNNLLASGMADEAKASVCDSFFGERQRTETAKQNAIAAQHNTETAKHNAVAAEHNTETAKHNAVAAEHNTETAKHNGVAAEHNTETERQLGSNLDKIKRMGGDSSTIKAVYKNQSQSSRSRRTSGTGVVSMSSSSSSSTPTANNNGSSNNRTSDDDGSDDGDDGSEDENADGAVGDFADGGEEEEDNADLTGGDDGSTGYENLDGGDVDFDVSSAEANSTPMPMPNDSSTSPLSPTTTTSANSSNNNNNNSSIEHQISTSNSHRSGLAAAAAAAITTTAAASTAAAASASSGFEVSRSSTCPKANDDVPLPNNSSTSTSMSTSTEAPASRNGDRTGVAVSSSSSKSSSTPTAAANSSSSNNRISDDDGSENEIPDGADGDFANDDDDDGSARSSTGHNKAATTPNDSRSSNADTTTSTIDNDSRMIIDNNNNSDSNGLHSRSGDDKENDDDDIAGSLQRYRIPSSLSTISQNEDDELDPFEVQEITIKGRSSFGSSISELSNVTSPKLKMQQNETVSLLNSSTSSSKSPLDGLDYVSDGPTGTGSKGSVSKGGLNISTGTDGPTRTASNGSTGTDGDGPTRTASNGSTGTDGDGPTGTASNVSTGTNGPTGTDSLQYSQSTRSTQACSQKKAPPTSSPPCIDLENDKENLDPIVLSSKAKGKNEGGGVAGEGGGDDASSLPDYISMTSAEIEAAFESTPTSMSNSNSGHSPNINPTKIASSNTTATAAKEQDVNSFVDHDHATNSPEENEKENLNPIVLAAHSETIKKSASQQKAPLASQQKKLPLASQKKIVNSTSPPSPPSSSQKKIASSTTKAAAAKEQDGLNSAAHSKTIKKSSPINSNNSRRSFLLNETATQSQSLLKNAPIALQPKKSPLASQKSQQNKLPLASQKLQQKNAPSAHNVCDGSTDTSFHSAESQYTAFFDAADATDIHDEAEEIVDCQLDMWIPRKGKDCKVHGTKSNPKEGRVLFGKVDTEDPKTKKPTKKSITTGLLDFKVDLDAQKFDRNFEWGDLKEGDMVGTYPVDGQDWLPASCNQADYIIYKLQKPAPRPDFSTLK